MSAPVYSVIATLATLAVTPTVATHAVTATPPTYAVEPWPDVTPAPSEPIIPDTEPHAIAATAYAATCFGC